MRFNPDLMRQILFYLEEQVPAGRSFHGEIRIEGFPQPEINETAIILLKEGYFEGRLRSGNRFEKPARFIVHRLTMKGHEFLANARNNTVWKKVLTKAQTEGTSVSVSILNGLLQRAAEKYAGLE